MAKGVHSRIKKKLRASKRQLMEQFLEPERERLARSLRLAARNLPYRVPQPANAFTEPENPNAEFPQYAPPRIIDFRSSHNPFSGREYSGRARPRVRKDGLISARLASEPSEELQKAARQKLPAADEERLIEQLIDLEIKKKGSGSAMEVEGPTKKRLRPKAKGLRRMLRF